MSVTIAGEPFASYMGVPGIEAEHVTLVLDNVSPRTEIQLLRYRHPEPLPDPHIRDLNKLGMNHICFVVGDIEAEVANLRANGSRRATRSWIFIPASWCSSMAPKASPSSSRSGIEAAGSARRVRFALDRILNAKHGSTPVRGYARSCAECLDLSARAARSTASGARGGPGTALRSNALCAAHSLAASSVSRNCTSPAASSAIGTPSR